VNDSTDTAIDPRCKEAHPESIEVGGTTFQRNDIVAKRYGETERTVNRKDRDGAPYTFFGGIKYRPQPDFDNFILARCIKRAPPQQPRGIRRRAR
jgi:hypothetical protein